MTGITNISNIHLWMFDNQDIGGSSGVWYTEWTHWIMDFSIKVHSCPGCPALNCSSPCYFGSCGIDLKCQCTSGYSGDKCETREWRHNSHSTLYDHPSCPLIIIITQRGNIIIAITLLVLLLLVSTRERRKVIIRFSGS